jgi:hypothetical protein
MIKGKTLKELEALLATSMLKADKKRPRITLKEPGVYLVTGSKPEPYEVRIGQTDDGQCFVACTCLGSLQKQTCYHQARAVWLHQFLVQL